ncbi:MAG: N-6 DNA methylase [Selenomonadaceae bacterium]|nr:N-6 DNA methylase [Selenomonadaceae bacterium]
MITVKNFPEILNRLGFVEWDGIFSEDQLQVDFIRKRLIYPEKLIGRDRCTLLDDSHRENLVVFECISKLLAMGYRAEDLELERTWQLGHDQKSGRADICIKSPDGKILCIIECKTFDREFEKSIRETRENGGQIFSYWQQERNCQWLVIYASGFVDGEIVRQIESVNCNDDPNILIAAQRDESIKLYRDARSVEDLFEVWDETYDKRFCGDVLFRDESRAYQIGVKPLRKKDLEDFSRGNRIVNDFEEILRHNNVSDKENAFNRLIALFICKLVDESNCGEEDEVEFQYKLGADTYETLQDRLQRLHRDGMEKFMQEKIFYVADDYPEKISSQLYGSKRDEMIFELRQTLRALKFFSNNDFAFKDVHNEELFYQNGKIVVEVVQLFEKYRIIGSKDLQLLGNLFEQLLSKGFKQNEGQFFTPIPITRFIWDSIPLEKFSEIPKTIDYACGAGHFLTQGFSAIQDFFDSTDIRDKFFGVEKDYRLARVSKISLFMHGAGDGNIIFGDGLENYRDKQIEPRSFDLLVANPPYSVASFKPHLKLTDNEFQTLEAISSSGSEIETLFVERISQLLKPKGIAAVILPSSILNKENESFILARKSILTNFYIRAIIQLGSKTFGATGTNTIIMFLEKFDEPPRRFNLINDTVDAIFRGEIFDFIEDRTIFDEYLKKIGVDEEIYLKFVRRESDYLEWKSHKYFSEYVDKFNPDNSKSANYDFYDWALKIEREKIRYFGLTYRQTTLVVTSPDEISAQEKFLGYSWSERKGSEGMKEKNLGGMLFDFKNRRAENRIAHLIRKSFEDQQIEIEELDGLYEYIPLKDMLDFSDSKFTNAMKTIPERRIRPGMKLFKLGSSDFEVSIGNRVLSNEVVEDGIYPVYSANVFEKFGRINKQNLKDFSRPSIIWGIDGDWMVNLIPESQPFYPTDHCGVLRVINSREILPRYLMFELRSLGNFMRFSRSNRASTRRIKQLVVQIPPMKDQIRIVSEISSIEDQIRKSEAIISKIDERIERMVFDSISKNETRSVRLDDQLLEFEKKSPMQANLGRSIGSFPFFTSSKSVKRIDESIYDGEFMILGTGGSPSIHFCNGKFSTSADTFVVKSRDPNVRTKFLYLYLKTHLEKLDSAFVGVGLKHISRARLSSVTIDLIPLDSQIDLLNSVEILETQKKDARDLILQHRKNLEMIVAKYFN